MVEEKVVSWVSKTVIAGQNSGYELLVSAGGGRRGKE